MNVIDQVRESNRIEGITREPTDLEVRTHLWLINLPNIAVDDLIAYVRVYQNNAVLRDRLGLNVRVGNHYPPPGGLGIPEKLDGILHKANLNPGLAWEVHIEYETLHPFTDGNGRSGRALWYYCMAKSGQRRLSELGFLHAFYYQTLDQVGR